MHLMSSVDIREPPSFLTSWIELNNWKIANFSTVNVNGEVISDFNKKAELFKSHFAS